MLSAARLDLKLGRFEIVAVAAAAVLLTAAALFFADSLAGMIRTAPECFISDRSESGPLTGPADLDPCQAVRERAGDVQGLASRFSTAMTALPFAVGLVLAVPLVGRELEHRTAAVAWALAGSRRRWLVRRVVPVLGMAVLALVMPALAADHLERARSFPIDPAATFDNYARRGALVVMRGLVVFAAALLTGALIGRVLPGLLVGAVISAGLIAATIFAVDAWVAPEAVAIDSGPGQIGMRTLEGRFRDREGRLLTFNEVEQRAGPEGINTSDYDFVAWGIPGSRYRDVEFREALILGGLAFVVGAASLVVVEHRRPY